MQSTHILYLRSPRHLFRIANMIKFVRRIAEWGIRPDTPIELAHHIRLTNVLLLFLFFGSIGETLVCFGTGAIDAAIFNCSAPIVFGGGLLLMRSGHINVARIFIVTVSYSAAYALVATLGQDSYFQFILLFASAFSLAFFSLDEKKLLIPAMVLPLIAFILLEVNGYQPVLGMSRAHLGKNQLIVMQIFSLALIWSLMVFHFFYFVRDRKRSQEQLVSSAKMVAMGRMAAGIAHEVNNPLQLIMSHAERLRNVAKTTGPAQDQLNQISDQIQSVALRIGSINKGLLALSRDATSDPLVEVPVYIIVDHSLAYCRAHLESHQIDLRISKIPKEWTVMGREAQLSEVILNILNNAYYAVADCQQKWIQIDTKAETNWIEISISDSGPGVSPKILHRIFDPFFTTKPVGKGTGLGLSVSQSLMAAHGGQLYYEPQTVGGKFVIRVPRAMDMA